MQRSFISLWITAPPQKGSLAIYEMKKTIVLMLVLASQVVVLKAKQFKKSVATVWGPEGSGEVKD